MQNMRKKLLLVAGFLALALGAIGIVLPILPTTPFVLVAASCFASSNPKLYQWLKRTKYLGEYIENYQKKTGVSKTVKRKSLVFLWVMLAASAIIGKSMVLTCILLVVGGAVTVHIKMLKSKVKHSEILEATRTD